MYIYRIELYIDFRPKIYHGSSKLVSNIAVFLEKDVLRCVHVLVFKPWKWKSLGGTASYDMFYIKSVTSLKDQTNDWQMKFNVKKCKTMHLGYSNSKLQYWGAFSCEGNPAWPSPWNWSRTSGSMAMFWIQPVVRRTWEFGQAVTWSLHITSLRHVKS